MSDTRIRGTWRPPIKILVADDDPNITELLECSLRSEGWEAISVSNGNDVITSVKKDSPDLVILDLMMPGMSGIEVCRRLVIEFSIPILILSARADIDDKVNCLNIGADDYLTKPFRIEELVARIRAVLRRYHNEEIEGGAPFQSGNLTVDFRGKRLVYRNKEAEMTVIESKLIRELIINNRKTLSYEYLLGKIWGSEYKIEREYLHTYIGRLRAKLSYIACNKEYIYSKRDIGYYFSDLDSQCVS